MNPKFVILTDVAGNPICVNTAHIMNIRADRDSTVLDMSDGTTQTVLETFVQLAARVRA